MPKGKYITEHLNLESGKCQRGYDCYENEVGNLGHKVDGIAKTIEELNQRCDKLQTLTKALVVG